MLKGRKVEKGEDEGKRKDEVTEHRKTKKGEQRENKKEKVKKE